MILPFDPRGGLIYVPTRLLGPSGETIALLALDTGATRSAISIEIALSLGYDPANAITHISVTTGSKTEYMARISIQRITALQQEHTNFPLLCHTLPPSAGVDGVLGLDFFRGLRLTLDFRTGWITVE